MLQKRRITFSDSYKNVSDISAAREKVLARSTVTRSTAKLALKSKKNSTINLLRPSSSYPYLIYKASHSSTNFLVLQKIL